ncbi:PRC-barrel domain-containing protein [Chamaesiphon sp. VAR_48_metabat_135_sub]|uniref:PRC-barrel domain-containing protein n=1 Tax=Chamaesiphon sp. VAR_48_metabat_135_sub TaxID=2964699 RepID=UPI00286C49B9|nr:PRC-barrel domain-containing protein [Chamaesiphon sp. VAR_48_metabat_135_sub]
MRKGSDIVGKPIVAYDTGEKVGRVRDLIFDQERNYLVALLVQEGGFMSDARVLPLLAIQSIGMDAAIVSRADNIIPAKSDPQVAAILARNNIMNGTHIMTVSGQDLGKMVDLYFDETTGAIEGYEVSGGIFADAYSGRSFVPAVQTLRIGENYAFVPAMVADLMEEQVGGIKAAIQDTSEKVQAAAHKAGEQISEVSRQATTQVANAIVDPESQKQFVLGRKTASEVLRPDGSVFLTPGKIVTMADAMTAENIGILDRLYRAAGGNLAEDAKQRASEIAQDLTQKANATTARYTIDQALGRRATTVVRTRDGLIVAAPGQIVTEKTIERAQTYHLEEALLRSVGLSTSNAAKSSANDALDAASSQISHTGDRVQSGIAQSIEWAKQTGEKLRSQTTHALEEQQIKGALGRPATRVILDKQDRVILNTGELITHRSIEAARRAEMLEVLLSSVYTKTPEFSEATLRAPEPGRASLPAAS